MRNMHAQTDKYRQIINFVIPLPRQLKNSLKTNLFNKIKNRINVNCASRHIFVNSNSKLYINMLHIFNTRLVYLLCSLRFYCQSIHFKTIVLNIPNSALYTKDTYLHISIRICAAHNRANNIVYKSRCKYLVMLNNAASVTKRTHMCSTILFSCFKIIFAVYSVYLIRILYS